MFTKGAKSPPLAAASNNDAQWITKQPYGVNLSSAKAGGASATTRCLAPMIEYHIIHKGGCTVVDVIQRHCPVIRASPALLLT